MKVLLINGSPHEAGCTYTALAEVAKEIEAAGIETEIFQIGKEAIHGCMGCGYCRKNGKCVYDDSVNACIEKVAEADGFIFGSPVHYAAISGGMSSFLDRLFYTGAPFAFKPGAAVVSCRRAGSTASLDELNKYFTIAKMPVVYSQYWNMVHGSNAAQVLQDEEGMQSMRVLGRNMVWMLQCIEAGKKAGVKLPEQEERIYTNFVR